MDAHQETLANPYGMDEDCRNCDALCETRTTIVHGYGDVGADFLFVGEQPDPAADRTGVPFTGGERRLFDALDRLGLCADAGADPPEFENVFLTHLTRCRTDDRPPTDGEVTNCEPFLSAEIRMINPEVIVPVGDRPLQALAEEYTTKPADRFSLPDHHAESIRGRGFELFPTVAPGEMTDEQLDTLVAAFDELLSGDYRQTKGRRGR